jgi:hypothetical protein
MGIAEPPCHRVPLLWRTAFPGWIPEQTLLRGTLPNESMALAPSAGALDAPTACQQNGRRVRTAPHGTTTQLGLGLGAWCAAQGCNEPCASIYGWWEAGAKSMIGWRAACSRKHALAIWRRELDPDFEPMATPDAGSRTT